MLIHVLCCSTIYISECTRFWDLTITGHLVSQRSLGRADINKGPPTSWCRELGHAHCRVFSCLQQTVGHDTLFCVGIDDVAHLSSPLKFFQTLSSSCTVSDDLDIRDSPPISVSGGSIMSIIFFHADVLNYPISFLLVSRLHRHSATVIETSDQSERKVVQHYRIISPALRPGSTIAGTAVSVNTTQRILFSGLHFAAAWTRE